MIQHALVVLLAYLPTMSSMSFTQSSQVASVKSPGHAFQLPNMGHQHIYGSYPWEHPQLLRRERLCSGYGRRIKTCNASQCNILQMQVGKEDDLSGLVPGTGTSSLHPVSLAKLAFVGALLGPAVDAIHNQVLLQYDVLPVSIVDAKTSILIPPLLALAYTILGGSLPPLVRKVVGVGKFREPLLSLDSGPRAIAAVVSTALVIRLSVTLSALPPTVALPALSFAALIQWIALDATWASLALGIAAGIGGPISEIPLMAGGCWHYLAPDYFPLHALGVDDAVGGLSALTGPCYFAVTTDSIALGKWFEAQRQRPSAASESE